MFVLDPLHPLFTAVLDIVASNPGIAMGELHAKLLKRREKDVRVTLQHAYRVVTRLIDEQILLKTKGKLSVNLMWLSYVEFFAEKAKKTIGASAHKANVLPLEPNKRATFHASTLLDVQTIWNHLLVQLNRMTQEKFLFKYYSHAWWQVGRNALDAEFYRRIRDKGVHCYWLYGGDTFLDHSAANENQDLFETRIVQDAPFPNDGYNVNVYGEYIMECIFPDKIARQLGFLFESVGSKEKFDEDLLADIFAEKAEYKVTLWRHKKQAATVRAQIAKYFVVPNL